MKKTITINDDCISCGQCLEICPNDAIDIISSHGYARSIILQDLCLNCGVCLKFDCPNDCFEIK